MFLYKKGKLEEINNYDEPNIYHKERINYLVDNDESDSFMMTNNKLYNTVYDIVPLTREQTYRYHRALLTRVLGYEPRNKDDVRITKFKFDVDRVKNDFGLVSAKIYEDGKLPVNHNGYFIIHDFDVKKGEEAGILSFFGINRKFTNLNEISKYLLLNDYDIIRVVYLNPYFRYILIGKGEGFEEKHDDNYISKITYRDKGIEKSIERLSGKFNINLSELINDNITNEELFNIGKKTSNKSSYGVEYNVSERRTKDIKSILSSIKFTMKNPVYLDIGSNTGENTKAIGHSITSKENIHGIDNYDTGFMGKDITMSEGVDLMSYKDDKIPLDDDSVDVITILQTLHHIEDVDNIMSEILRITHKGSIVILREHECYNTNYRYIIDIEHLLYSSREVNSYEDFHNTYYAKYFSERELDNLFISNNFKKMKIDTKLSTPSGATRYYYAVYKRL